MNTKHEKPPQPLGRLAWEKMLLRWSGMEPSGEVKLICAVIADGIIERERDHWFFSTGGFESYCSVIGLSPVFVLEQMYRAADFHEKELAEWMQTHEYH
jgi:hypothetical protein